MPVIKAFFFDMDGTLVDTYEADYLAYRDAIQEVTGKVIEPTAFARTHGQEMRSKLAVLIPGLEEDAIQKIRESKKRHYPKYTHLTVPNNALIHFLATSAKDHKNVLVTTAKRQNALIVLETHKILHYFSETVFGDDVVHPKPHPEPYLLALKKTSLKPEDVIAFEDSESGVASATAANIPVIRIRSFT